MEQILNLIDSFSAGFINLLKMIAMHFCGLAVTATNRITDPEIQGATKFVIFFSVGTLLVVSIRWWFSSLGALVSVRKPNERRTSLSDVVWLGVATFVTPTVILLVCFFILCWWQST